MKIVPEPYLDHEFQYEGRSKKLNGSVYISLGATSVVVASKTHALATIGHFFTSGILLHSGAVLSIPLAISLLYKYKSQDSYDPDKLDRDLSSFPVCMQEVDLQLLEHINGNCKATICLSNTDLQISHTILERIIENAFGSNESLLYFNPTKERCYCVQKGCSEAIEEDLSVEAIEELLVSGLNYRGIIVFYSRFLLAKVLLPSLDMQDSQISLYDYNLGLTQIIAAAQEYNALFSFDKNQ